MSISRRPVILGGKWNETMEEQTMKYGVIDVGGGLRGIYGAGVLDRCLEEDLRFDLCIGVSAGSANMSSYLAGQHGRNKPFYDEYSFRREYMSVHNLIHKHSYLDLGYVYGTLSNAGGENPLDYAALARSPAELCVVAANAQNGEAQYFTKADLHPDDYRVLMVSCCIPVIDQPCVIDGVPYFDGGVDILDLNIDGIALATVADSFAAIEQRVVEEKKLTWDRLFELLDTNYEGAERERLMLKNIRRFGSPGSRAQDWAVRIRDYYVALCKGAPTRKHHLMIVPGLFSHGDVYAYGKTLEGNCQRPLCRRCDFPFF